MNELIRHIEYLLLSHDCVIIPQFGGFVTHYRPACWSKESKSYLPPARTIGFNALLKLNDGLLAQSYMETYDTDFSDANRKLEKDVRKLIQQIHEEGEVTLKGIGTLLVDVDDSYLFTPETSDTVCPDLYGLAAFHMDKLPATPQHMQWEKAHKDKAKNVYEIRIQRTLVRNLVAAAIAIIAFFVLSTPVENTYVEADNYAMLFPTEVTTFHIRENQQSKHTHTVQPEKKEKKLPAKPKAVRIEKVQKKAAANQQPVSIKKRYHIIIASVTSRAEAEATVSKYTQKGYSGMEIIEGDGRIRVCLASFSGKSEAYRQLNQLKEDASFKDAWLLCK